MELSVKGRGTGRQRVVLEAWISQGSRRRFVVTSTERALRAAVLEVRDNLQGQINRHVTRREGARRRQR